METVRAFAPSTIANLGPGFDVLGLALTGPGDTVEVKRVDQPGVIIEAVAGDNGRLPRDPAMNTAGVAAQHVLDFLDPSAGVALTLIKDLPLGSGLGSSAASAAAAIWAVAALLDFEEKLPLLPAGVAAEAVAGGYHADNIAPALLGGMIAVQRCDAEQIVVHQIPSPTGLYIVLVTPEWEIQTRRARQLTPQTVPLRQMVANAGNLSGLIIAGFHNDVHAFGRSIIDGVIEPARAPLIPGFATVKAAAMDAGALGCSIGGSGPTVFAMCDSPEVARQVGAAMQRAFAAESLASAFRVAQVDPVGARLL